MFAGGLGARAFARGESPFVPPRSSSVVPVSGQVNGLIVQPSQRVVIDGTLETTANVIVHGTLKMRAGSTLRFLDVDESEFVGSGMDVLGTDTGLWVMQGGRLDIQGTPKTGWVRMGPGDEAPADWDNGDQILVCPNGSGEWNPGNFSIRTFPNVNPPPRFALPDGRQLPTECANLTRDVVIEGTPGGRAHILIRSTPSQPHIIKHCLIRHMGPRYSPADDDNVLGRYPLHFHHSGDGSRDTVVEGVVVRDSGNHAFVPHVSHGITMRDCVAYRITEDAYWWDPGDETDDLLWKRCLAADVRNPSGGGHRQTAFLLGQGTNMTAIDCAAVGVNARSDASGFHWPEHANKPPNIWRFENNVAHNCAQHGLFTWQNNQNLHPIGPFVVYNCGLRGVQHGAYKNSYRYHDFVLSGVWAGIHWKAKAHPNGVPRPDGYHQSFERGVIDDVENSGIHVGHHNGSDELPALFKDIGFGPGVQVKLRATTSTGERSFMDFVSCGIEPEDTVLDAVPGSVFRFQRADGTAFKLDHQGNMTEIAPFYPTGGFFIADESP